MSSTEIDLIESTGGFGSFQKRYAVTILAAVWAICGAHTMPMSFVTQEPPRYPTCLFNRQLASVDSSSDFNSSSELKASSALNSGLSDLPILDNVTLADLNASQLAELLNEAPTACNPFIPLPSNDCNSDYFYYHPTATVVSEFKVPHANCSSTIFGGAAWTNSFFFVGFLIGVAFLGRVADMGGRRPGLISSVIVMQIAALLSVLSGSLVQYGLTRLFVGFGVGGTGLLSFITLAEITSERTRAIITLIHASAFAVGGCATCLLATVVPNWRVLLLSITLPGMLVLFTVCSKFAVESPRWLAAKGFGDRSLQVWKFIARKNGRELPPSLTGEQLVHRARFEVSRPSDQQPIESIYVSPEDSEKHVKGASPMQKKFTDDPESQSEFKNENEDFLDYSEGLNASKEGLFSVFRVSPLKRWSPVMLFLWFSASLSYYGIYFDEANLLKSHQISIQDQPLTALFALSPFIDSSNNSLNASLNASPNAADNSTENAMGNSMENVSPNAMGNASFAIDDNGAMPEAADNASTLKESEDQPIEGDQPMEENSVEEAVDNAEEAEDGAINEMKGTDSEVGVNEIKDGDVLNGMLNDEIRDTENNQMETEENEKNQIENGEIENNEINGMLNEDVLPNEEIGVRRKLQDFNPTFQPTSESIDNEPFNPKDSTDAVDSVEYKIPVFTTTTTSTSNPEFFMAPISVNQTYLPPLYQQIQPSRTVQPATQDFLVAPTDNNPTHQQFNIPPSVSNNSNNSTPNYPSNASLNLPPASNAASEDSTGLLQKVGNAVNYGVQNVRDYMVAQNISEKVNAVGFELGKGLHQVQKEIEAMNLEELWNSTAEDRWEKVNQRVFYHFAEEDPDVAFWQQTRQLALATFFMFLTEIVVACLTVFLASCACCGRRGVILLSFFIGGLLMLTAFTFQFILANASVLFHVPLLANLGRLCISGGFLLLYLYSSELYPTSVRASVVGLLSTSARIAGIIAPLIVAKSQILLPGSALLIFGLLCLISSIWACKVLPETLGVPLADTIATLRMIHKSQPSGRKRNRRNSETVNLRQQEGI